jgi:hypothetical protein
LLGFWPLLTAESDGSLRNFTCQAETRISRCVTSVIEAIKAQAEKIGSELRSSGFTLSQADIYVVAVSQAIALGSRAGYSPSEMLALLNRFTLQR